MRGWRSYCYLLTALLLSGGVQAQSLSLTAGADRIAGGSAPGGTAPPGMPTPAVAYSFRKLLSTANSLKAARIRRASDNAEQDIGFVGNNFDTATATTFCASTSCFVKTMYDQTLTGRDVGQIATASQPELVFSCLGANPCLRTVGASTLKLITASFTPSSAVMSMSGVSKRVSGTINCYVITGSDTNRIQHTNGSAGYTLLANVSIVASAAGATENVWHSTVGIINGASSSLVWDTTTVSGTGTGSMSAGPNTVAQGGGTTTCHLVEAIFWDATALTAQQAADLNANQKLYWGF
jgi:hypothetical protein